MHASTATRFAVIDEKLNDIQKSLVEVKEFMKDHATEHKEINATLTKHQVAIVIIGVLATAVAGALISKLIGGI